MSIEPRVGVGVCLRKYYRYGEHPNHVLMGKRKGSHGAGTWSFPGGHLEYAEAPVACAMRELEEEVGFNATRHLASPPPPFASHRNRIEPVGFTSDLIDDLHYVTLFVRAYCVEDFEPELLEPDKCSKWAWFPANTLPAPLFPPIQSALRDPKLERLFDPWGAGL